MKKTILAFTPLRFNLVADSQFVFGNEGALTEGVALSSLTTNRLL